MKRFLATLLCLTLCLSPALAAENLPGFTDVPADARYAPYVEACADAGLINGVGGGRFAPEQNFTYGECIAIAARLHYSQNGGTGDLPAAPANYGIEDENWTPYPQWFLNAYYYLSQATDGELTTSWRLSIVRSEWIRIMALAVPNEALTPINHIKSLPDTDDSTVLNFYNAGLLTGTDSLGSFNGRDWNVTRAEAAALLGRVIRPELRRYYAPEPTRYALTPLALPDGYNGYSSTGDDKFIYNFSIDEYRAFGDYIYLEDNGYTGVMALDGSWLLSPELGFHMIAPFCSDGVAAAEKDGKWGYIDKAGRVVVPLIYGEAAHLHDGLLLAVSDSGEYCVFTADANQTATLPATSDTYDSLVVFDTTGDSIRYSKDKKMGYLKADGTLLLEAQWYDAQPFSEGLAAVRNSDFPLEPGYDDGGQYGYIDESGTLVIPYEFWYPSVFTGGIASYLRVGYLTPDGVIHSTESFGGFRQHARFSDGYISWFDGDTLREGYMDRELHLLTPDIFLDTAPICNGRAVVRNTNGEHYILTVTQQ